MDEIIVDDVDVSECSCFEEVYEEQMPYGDVLTINNYCIHTGEECEGCNCFYKQNKRLKQENERLKAENEKLNKMTGIFSARLCGKYRQAMQEIREYATDLIDGAAGGCEPDIGTILLKRIDEVIGEEE